MGLWEVAARSFFSPGWGDEGFFSPCEEWGETWLPARATTPQLLHPLLSGDVHSGERQASYLANRRRRQAWSEAVSRHCSNTDRRSANQLQGSRDIEGCTRILLRVLCLRNWRRNP